MMDHSPQRRCSKCGEFFPATPEYFHKHGDGLRPNCKACERERKRQHYAEHLERERERMRRYRIEKPEIARRYYADNCERKREYKRWYSAENAQKVRESGRRYRVAHPEKDREKVRRYRARKRNLQATFTAAHERLALEYFHHCCAVCGRQLHDLFGTHTVHWDHWIPISKDGGSTPENMLPLCGGVGGCNQSKRSNDAIGWLNRKFGKRRAVQILTRIETYFEWIKSTYPGA